MFVKEKVSQTVLIVSGSTAMSSLQLYLLSYQSFDVKSLLLPWDACVYRQLRDW